MRNLQTALSIACACAGFLAGCRVYLPVNAPREPASGLAEIFSRTPVMLDGMHYRMLEAEKAAAGRRRAAVLREIQSDAALTADLVRQVPEQLTIDRRQYYVRGEIEKRAQKVLKHLNAVKNFARAGKTRPLRAAIRSAKSAFRDLRIYVQRVESVLSAGGAGPGY